MIEGGYMDFIREDGSFIRIENDRIEGYRSDGTCLFSFRPYDPPPVLDSFTSGEYEFTALPTGIAIIRKSTKEG